MLPELAAIEYDSATHEFRHTTASTLRTAQSASAFAAGFLNMTSQNVELTTEEPDEDWLLYYYNLCQKYLEVRPSYLLVHIT